MKGFIVANRINDIYFMDVDDEFAKHVNKQAKEQGLINEISEDEAHILEANIVMQLFSPIFMSQWFMIDQRKNPCKSITCENGFVFVFQHVEDLLIVAINGDGSETEEYLIRKTNMFVRMVEFLFGPVTDEIGYSKFSKKANRWNLLKGIMKTWNQLALEEHAFLVEAIERVHINMIVNERCVDVLDHAVNKLQNAGEKNTYHGLLFVNSKLLTLYSGRNVPELRPSDTLAIILLIKHLFPTNEKLEDLFSFSYRKSEQGSTKMEYQPSSPGSDRYDSAQDDIEDDDEKYASALESPNPERGSDSDNPFPEMSISLTDEKRSTPIESKTPSRTPTPEALHKTNSLPLFGRRRSRTFEGENVPGVNVAKQIVGGGRARSRSWVEPRYDDSRATPPEVGPKTATPPVPEEVESIPFYMSHIVFLQNELCNHCPHQLHCIQVFPGITLVLVSEMPRASLANTLCQVLFLLKQVVLGKTSHGYWAQGQNMYDTVNTLISKMSAPLRRAKGNVPAIFNDILKKWDDPVFKSLLLNYLEQPRDKEIPPSIERSLTYLLKKMKDLFLFLYLLPRPLTPQLERMVTQIRERAGQKLRDFKDYLCVKAQRNITMTSYIEQFPGLVHFIYIDRRTNQVTAPSFNITSGETTLETGETTVKEMDATRLLKDKVWKMMEFMQLKLKSGTTCVAAREGDYYFSYFLWFGDSSGNIITPQHPLQVSIPLSSPGVLTSNFYSMLLRRCFPNMIPGSIACFELMMMHVGLVSLSYITENRTRLTALLRSSSGESVSPMTLAL
ncbi:BLOC-3 complex member HPS1-like isoform X1 [Mytilus edulis]|uniref:BLOC-3 complex member HPS1-like isoform X1 n=2 Tax=Mytilus edulis TaxID=6550 RepID=UPI0039F12520